MLKNRALSGVLLAALACATGTDTAHAAPVLPIASLTQVPAAESVPARGIDLTLLNRTIRHQRRVSQGKRVANAKSTNWAGYAVTDGTFTSVSADWVEPNVTCTSNGIVGFWIGLDGWGSKTVEQDGTGVDCENGRPQQFAWWETYPANSIQVYDAPVAAGDRMSSTISYRGGGRYEMELTDWTARWIARNPISAPAAQNASAEIVAEAVTAGNDITALPDFGTVDFTDAKINGGSLQAASAKAIDMTDLSDNLIATTTAADAGGDFAVDYTGGTGAGTDPAKAPATSSTAPSTPKPSAPNPSSSPSSSSTSTSTNRMQLRQLDSQNARSTGLGGSLLSGIRRLLAGD